MCLQNPKAVCLVNGRVLSSRGPCSWSIANPCLHRSWLKPCGQLRQCQPHQRIGRETLYQETKKNVFECFGFLVLVVASKIQAQTHLVWYWGAALRSSWSCTWPDGGTFPIAGRGRLKQEIGNRSKQSQASCLFRICQLHKELYPMQSVDSNYEKAKVFLPIDLFPFSALLRRSCTDWFMALRASTRVVARHNSFDRRSVLHWRSYRSLALWCPGSWSGLQANETLGVI